MQIQADNSLGDLVFFIFLLTTLVLTAVFLYRRLRRRRIRTVALAILGCLGAYAAAVVAVSLGSETRQLDLGTDKCFDDWCATVVGAKSIPLSNAATDTKFVAVTLRVSNRARRAAFRPSQPRVTLRFAPAGAVGPSATAQHAFEKQAGPQPDLAQRLGPAESFQTTLVFEAPSATRQAFVVLLEGPAAVTKFIVGDENSFLHKNVVYPITVQ